MAKQGRCTIGTAIGRASPDGSGMIRNTDECMSRSMRSRSRESR
jgi:hypothetical protein